MYNGFHFKDNETEGQMKTNVLPWNENISVRNPISEIMYFLENPCLFESLFLICEMGILFYLRVIGRFECGNVLNNKVHTNLNLRLRYFNILPVVNPSV